MSRTNANRSGSRSRQPRRITVRSTRRTPPDLRKLSRALLELAAAQAEADAAAETAKKGSAPGKEATPGRDQRSTSHSETPSGDGAPR